MTNPTPYLTDGCLVLDGSGLALVKTCPTLARYKLIEKRERAQTTQKGRAPGKALHAALEARYRLAGGGRMSEEQMEAVRGALADAYAGVELVEGDEYLNLARMQTVLDQYLNGCRYEMGKAGKNGVYTHAGYAEEPFEVEGVEVAFAVEIGRLETPQTQLPGFGGTLADIPVIWIGRSDLLARWKERGEHVVVDHKTARRWSNADVNGWRMASSPMGYAYCLPKYIERGVDRLPPRIREAMQPHEATRIQMAERGIGSVAITGFCVNALVIRDVSDLSRCKDAPTSFHRELFYYQPAQLEEWRTNTLRWCQAWVEWCASGQWPMNDKSCAHQFGAMCPYYEVCSLPAEQRPILLATDLYTDNQWSPLNRATD